jgi:hypothetical protein
LLNNGQTGEPVSFKSGLGILGFFFGLPFLGGGIAAMYGGLTAQGTNAPPAAFIIPFSSIFIIVGLAVMFGRRGTIIDPLGRTVTKWWGLLFPFSSKSFTVEETGEVRTTKEVRRGQKSTTIVYVIKIHGESGSVIDVIEVKTSEDARKKGEQTAKALNLSLRDNCLGKEIYREAGTLDESLADRAKRTGELPVIPDMPGSCKIENRIEGTTAIFEIPPAGFGGKELAPLVMIGAGIIPFFIFTSFMFSGAGDAPIFFKGFMGLFFLIPLAVVGGMAYKVMGRVMCRQVIRIDPGMLEVKKIGPGGKSKSIPANELEELELFSRSDGTPTNPLAAFFGSSGKLVARSDTCSINIGEGLSNDELEWFHAVLYTALATS